MFRVQKSTKKIFSRANHLRQSHIQPQNFSYSTGDCNHGFPLFAHADVIDFHHQRTQGTFSPVCMESTRSVLHKDSIRVTRFCHPEQTIQSFQSNFMQVQWMCILRARSRYSICCRHPFRNNPKFCSFTKGTSDIDNATGRTIFPCSPHCTREFACHLATCQ